VGFRVSIKLTNSIQPSENHGRLEGIQVCGGGVEYFHRVGCNWELGRKGTQQMYHQRHEAGKEDFWCEDSIYTIHDPTRLPVIATLLLSVLGQFHQLKKMKIEKSVSVRMGRRDLPR